MTARTIIEQEEYPSVLEQEEMAKIAASNEKLARRMSFWSPSLRSLVLSTPRRFLSYADFKEYLRLIPHVLALEIMDGLPEVPAVKYFERSNFTELLGRFSNSMDRNFVLVRRSIVFDIYEVSEALYSQTKYGNPVAFKRDVALLLRHARHICWSQGRTYYADNSFIAIFLRSLLGKELALSNIRSIRLLGATALYSLIPGRVLKNVTHLVVSNDSIASCNAYYYSMHKLKHLKVHDSPVDWAVLPISQIRSLELERMEKRVDLSFIYMISSDYCAYYRIGIYMYDGAVFANTLFVQCIQQVLQDLRLPSSVAKGCILEQACNLRRLTLSDGNNSPEVYSMIQTLNYRGNLSFLRLETTWGNKNFIPNRGYLEAIGVGSENCSLRELQIDTFSPTGIDVFIPIIRCPQLESVEFTIAPKEKRADFIALAYLLVDRGILLDCKIQVQS